jgi:superfamily II DNA/RNA helicase
MSITDYQAKYLAYELTRQHAANGVDKLSQSLFDASVDLNPHQINAALFALKNPLSQGVMLADEVGLGKTIEAGLVISQYWAERKRRVLIIAPASLRRQWAQELQDKFNLPSQIVDAKTSSSIQKQSGMNPLTDNRIVILSYHYAARIADALLAECWDLVVIDEAHKLRNAHRATNKMGQVLKRALTGRKKLLLTATPLQNSLIELYGLSTVIDEQLFGDERSFKEQFVRKDSAVDLLKMRLKPFVHRTLRKDVLEYIQYTQRQALTVPFKPTTQEQRLYEGISALLEREDSYALPKRQRHLTGLILRKLLASSSRAVLNTLETILRRLKSLQSVTARSFASQVDEADLAEFLVEDDDLPPEYLEENSDLDAGQASTARASDKDIDQKSLALEIQELEGYIVQAKTIETDTKATALLTALTQGFARMQAMGAPRKAIVFTESKRTQDYLVKYLEANGYQDQLVTFSGSNNHPAATAIYQHWLNEHKGSDKISGSPQVDRRTALIDHFRDHAEVMIATEAAAEGVNLQFCSLVINYDLPWNPQRVEQRIGRCHRYGQKFDVVVINFLNDDNLADKRVLELLAEKFHLFDGVFGVSDDVLGSLESGLDFEKRIQAIYDTCRTPQAIEAAFIELQQLLEADIQKQMQQTRQLLLDNFDEDIHDLLRVQLNAAEQRLDKVGRWFWALTQHQLQNCADFSQREHSFILKQEIAQAPLGRYRLIRHGNKTAVQQQIDEQAHIYRLTHPLGEWVLTTAKQKTLSHATIEFNYADYPTKISVLDDLVRQSGTLMLQKFTVESLDRSEDHLLFAAENDEGHALHADAAQKLMQVPARVVSTAISSTTAESSHADCFSRLQSQLNQLQQTVNKEVNDRNLSFFEQEVSKLDDWADDLKEGLEQAIKELDKMIKQIRREAKIAATLEEKLAFQKQQKNLEAQRNQSRRELFDKQDEVDARREAIIENLESKLNRKTHSEALFTIDWRVV